MTPSEQYEAGLFLTTAHHQSLFDQWASGLPDRSDETPYGSMAHCVRPIESALQYVFGIGSYTDRKVLEIGFNLGRGAAILLGLGCGSVVSIEPRTDDQTMEAERVLGRAFPASTLLVHRCRSDDTWIFEKLRGTGLGLAFIDGDHSEATVTNDIDLCRELGIQWMLLDDYFPKWGIGVQLAIENADLLTVAIFGNFALCIRKDDFLNS